jgi:hypothetical protein
MDAFWELLEKVPETLEQFGNYSWALLVVILALGAGLLVYARSRPKAARAKLVSAGLVLAAAAVGGGILKGWASVERRRAVARWVESQKAPPGELRIVVANFFPTQQGAGQPDGQAPHALVSTLTSVLGEDLPEAIPAPLVVPVDFNGPVSPWQGGVTQANLQDILNRLSALEILWGDVDVRERVVRAFIGFPADLGPLDPVVSLSELPIADDPRRDVRFGTAYHRVLGHVALGVALDTARAAHKASGDERRRLFLRAARQLGEAQALVAGYRDDAVLKKTLYGSRTAELLSRCNAEAGVTP